MTVQFAAQPDNTNLTRGETVMTAVTSSTSLSLSSRLRGAVLVTAVIDLLIGLAFLLGPELNINLWPTPVGVELKRFIGAIVLANGIGALMVVRQGTWAGARVLFTVALVYGLAVFAFLLFDLLRGEAVTFFWGYVAVDAVFLFPILAIYLTHERDFRARGV